MLQNSGSVTTRINPPLTPEVIRGTEMCFGGVTLLSAGKSG
jgi:hypothetical protein